MLRRIKVDGFKSLVDFELEFQPGLNVLVGPNGSGKSNVIKFLEFLSDIVGDNFSGAFERLGGVGDVFHRGLNGELVQEITFSVEGENFFYLSQGDIYLEKTEFKYKFENTISIDGSALYLRHQKISIYFKKSIVPDMFVELGYEYNSGAYKALPCNHISTDMKKEIADYLMLSKNYIDRILEDKFNNRSMIVGLRILNRLFDRIHDDLNFKKSFNIIPAIVRESNSIGYDPHIDQEGRGLAAVLNRFKSDEELLPTNHPLYPTKSRSLHFSEAELQKIQDLCGLVVDDFSSIESVHDKSDHKLRVFVNFSSATKTYKLPIALVSDGMAKWFALVTAIVTGSTMMMIEEPENYLHPKLQQILVDLLRSYFDCADDDRLVLLTTHSETMLNALEPDEIIVTTRTDLKTHCARPSNAALLSEVISESGFGLGYFYVTDAIEA